MLLYSSCIWYWSSQRRYMLIRENKRLGGEDIGLSTWIFISGLSLGWKLCTFVHSSVMKSVVFVPWSLLTWVCFPVLYFALSGYKNRFEINYTEVSKEIWPFLCARKVRICIVLSLTNAGVCFRFCSCFCHGRTACSGLILTNLLWDRVMSSIRKIVLGAKLHLWHLSCMDELFRQLLQTIWNGKLSTDGRELFLFREPLAFQGDPFKRREKVTQGGILNPFTKLCEILRSYFSSVKQPIYLFFSFLDSLIIPKP